MASVDLICRTCGTTRACEDPRTGAIPACACGGRLALPAAAVFACAICGVRSKPALVELDTARPCPRCRQPLHVAAFSGAPAASPSVATRPATVAATVMLPAEQPLFIDDAAPDSNPTVTHATRHEPSPSGGGLATGATFGRYEIVREIARGGMGIVYEARDPTLKRSVALKVLIAGEVASTEAVARFVREARAAGQLRHPHIVAVHDAGEITGQHFFTMDLIRGRELGPAAAEAGLERALGWMQQVCLALHHAHEHRIVHRDLKPGNIMVDHEDRPVIMDFGLAKDAGADSFRSLSGAIFGTPAYMSPEQAQGQTHAIDRRTDVYALGVILYELATGSRPFAGDTLFDTIRAVVSDEPRAPITLKPGLAADLDTIILRCLEKRPADRYPTALALAEDLERHLAGEDITAQRVAAPRRLWRTLRRRPALLAGVGAGAVALVAGAVAALLLIGDSFIERLARETAGPDAARARAAATTLAGQLGEGRLTADDATLARLALRGLIGGADPDAEAIAIGAATALPDGEAGPALLALASDPAATAPRRIAAAGALGMMDKALADRPAAAAALVAAATAERGDATLVGALASAAARLDPDAGAAALAPAAEDASRAVAQRVALVRALPGAAPLHGPTMKLLLRLAGDRDPLVGEAAVARLGELRTRAPVFAFYGLEKSAGAAFAGAGAIQQIAANQARAAEAILGEMDGDAPAPVDPVTVIAARLTGGERESRLAAAVDLSQLGGPGAVAPLVGALGSDDSGLRRAAGRALVRLAPRTPVAATAITPLLVAPDPGVRADAATTLGELEAREAVPALDAALAGERTPATRLALIEALGRVGDPAALPALRTAWTAASGRDSGDAATACVAAFAHAKAQDGAAYPDLIAGLDHPSRAVREAALGALRTASGETIAADAAAWRRWLDSRGAK